MTGHQHSCRSELGPNVSGRAAPPRPKRRRTSEAGDATVTAVAVIPIVMLMCFAIVQTAVGWYAQTALNAAAQDGLRSAQTNPAADPASNAIVSAQASARLNANFVNNLHATTATPTVGQLKVTVTGNVAGLFPGLTRTLTAKASGPLETFRAQGNQ